MHKLHLFSIWSFNKGKGQLVTHSFPFKKVPATQVTHLEGESTQVRHGELHGSHFLVVIFFTVFSAGQLILHSLKYIKKLFSQSIQLIELRLHVSQGVEQGEHVLGEIELSLNIFSGHS